MDNNSTISELGYSIGHSIGKKIVNSAFDMLPVLIISFIIALIIVNIYKKRRTKDK